MEQKGTEWLCPSCKKEKSVGEREVKPKSGSRGVGGGNRQIAKRQNSQSGDSPNSSMYGLLLLRNSHDQMRTTTVFLKSFFCSYRLLVYKCFYSHVSHCVYFVRVFVSVV